MDREARRPGAPRGCHLCIMVAICLMGFFLRLFRIEAQSLWWDEALSLHLATSSVADILADRAAHVHPPLYFLLLKGWVSVAGTSAFSIRLASTWFNMLLLALAYVFGRRYGGRTTGLLAALVTAASPLYIVYSQEARVYAMLPLLYAALLTVVGHLISLPRARTPRSAWRDWLLLVTVEAVGLYLHYIFFLAVAYANLMLLLEHWHTHRSVRRWLTSLVLVGLLCLPWVASVFANRAAVMADAGVDDPFSEPVPLGFFAHLLWSFQWTGLTAAPGYPTLQAATLALGGLLLAALGLLLAERSTRPTTACLLAHWIVPLAPTVLLWQAKPLSHPRYVIGFSVALFLVAAYAIATIRRRGSAGKILAALLALGLVITSCIALQAWYCEPRFAKDDVKGLARWLEANTGQHDVIVAPWQDWSLDYAYRGAAAIIRPNTADEDSTWKTLRASPTGTRRAFLVTYPRASVDRRNLVPFALESAGHLTEQTSFKGLVVRRYTLVHPMHPPPPGTPASAAFGPLRLVKTWTEEQAPANTAVCVSLGWQLDEPVNEQYRASLHLQDPAGWTWATTDAWLLDQQGLLTDQWGAAELVTTYHILPLPSGTPPLTYTVSVDVYTVEPDGALHYLDLLDTAGNPAGRSYRSAPVSLAPAIDLTGDPYQSTPDIPAPVEPFGANGLTLEGAALDRESVAPGQSLFVTLRWRAETAPLPDLRPTLSLRQDDATVTSVSGVPAAGRYSTDRWRAGETILDHHRLTIPAAARVGSADVVLCLDLRCTALGTVQITAEEHRFEPPPMATEVHVRFGQIAELLGYDLAPGPYVSGQPITISLYWRALDDATGGDYTVFAHVLAADGHLVAQHDGPPAEGTRPTPGWLPGEVITNPHAMVFREEYTGSAMIEVGLYDSASMQRVQTAQGGDVVVLPAQLSIGQ